MPGPTQLQIAQAVTTMRRVPDADDLSLFGALRELGMKAPLAARLVEFVPLVYCRLLLSRAGVHFSDYFRRGNAESELTPFVSDPVWNAVLEFAETERNGGFQYHEFVAVAGRSAEFQGVNDLLNQGSKPQDIALLPVVLPWSEEGPPLLA